MCVHVSRGVVTRETEQCGQGERRGEVMKPDQLAMHVDMTEWKLEEAGGKGIGLGICRACADTLCHQGEPGSAGQNLMTAPTAAAGHANIHNGA